jgi:hypothetical protein
LDLLMVILASHGLDDTGVCVYTLRLVLAYCKPSGTAVFLKECHLCLFSVCSQCLADTNVGVIIRKGGVVVLADLLTNYAHDTVIASLCVDCLALCARTGEGVSLCIVLVSVWELFLLPSSQTTIAKAWKCWIYAHNWSLCWRT